MKLLPPDVVSYQRTKEFSEITVPKALTARHSTKAGVWGRINVVQGTLHYRILEPMPEEHSLSPDHPGVVEPEILHEVEPIGKVRFFVEFFRAPK